MYISIFYLQIERPQGSGDDTSLNKVSLSCRHAETLEYTGEIRPKSGYCELIKTGIDNNRE